jgi:DNA-binding HxlR family transcriptional regulator
MKKKEKDSFIHVKLEYNEAKQSKRDLLASEADIINIIQSMNKYAAIREIELNLKSKFYREIKKIAMEVKLLEANLPQIRAPKLITRHTEEKPVEVETIKTKGGDELEKQLMDIQKRLKELSY